MISLFVTAQRRVPVYHSICLCSTREISSECNHLVDTLGSYSAVGSLLKERAEELPCEHLLIWHSDLCWDVLVTKGLCRGHSVCNLLHPWLCYRSLLSQNSKKARKKYKRAEQDKERLSKHNGSGWCDIKNSQRMIFIEYFSTWRFLCVIQNIFYILFSYIIFSYCFPVKVFFHMFVQF